MLPKSTEGNLKSKEGRLKERNSKGWEPRVGNLNSKEGKTKTGKDISLKILV